MIVPKQLQFFDILFGMLSKQQKMGMFLSSMLTWPTTPGFCAGTYLYNMPVLSLPIQPFSGCIYHPCKHKIKIQVYMQIIFLIYSDSDNQTDCQLH